MTLPNKRMQQTKRDGSPPTPVIVTESRFAADPPCSADAFLQKLSSLTDTDAGPRI
jgi:hypothetical protein